MRCSSSSSRVRSFWSWLTTDCISVFGMKQSYHSELDPRRFLRKVLVNWRNIAITLRTRVPVYRLISLSRAWRRALQHIESQHPPDKESVSYKHLKMPTNRE